MNGLSVTVITYNEEDRVAAAVASAVCADEVLVLDAGSGDDTVSRARAAGARVEIEHWRGFGGQRNRAAALARHDWILSLDADERINDELARSIGALADWPEEAAFLVSRCNAFAGRRIRRWPWSVDAKARLYNRRRARFSEPRIHETLVADGSVGRVTGLIEHLGSPDWEDLARRQHRYAQLGASEARRRGRKPHLGDQSLRPLATFLRHWLGRGYLLNGVLGWQLALTAARGTALKYRLLRREYSK